MKQLGTILPTKKSLRAGTKQYSKDVANRMKVAKEKGLDKLKTTQTKDGEIRYWESEFIYCVVSRGLMVLRFEVTCHGDYRI